MWQEKLLNLSWHKKYSNISIKSPQMKLLATLLLLSICTNTFAQTDSSYYNPNISRTLYYLKPLKKINGNYYYGERKLKGFFALEVPFYELNDVEVNHHYKQFKTFSVASQIISIVPSIYLLSTISNTRLRQNGYYTNNFIVISLASIGGSLICTAIGKSHIQKAAIRYNRAIGKDNLGYWQFKNDDKSLGISLKYNF